jgi:molybdopterin molybdotransferase
MKTIVIPLSESSDYISADTVIALVDSPSADVSMKDGYAVRSAEIIGASPQSPVTLALSGIIAAGHNPSHVIDPGTAIRILTGAKIPKGADTVVAEEHTALADKTLSICRQVDPGQNILDRGSDVARDEILVRTGDRLKPGKIGLLAAGGHENIRVFNKPRVALVATGDEILLPGQPPVEGKLYASNLFTLNAWCRKFGMMTKLEVIGDDEYLLRKTLKQAIRCHDAVITSGGAWTGDRDLVVRVLDDLGWEKVYHRVRLGPGKAVGFGILGDKPIFILPGGPPSNLVAFLQLALPGLLQLAGYKNPKLPETQVILQETVKGQADWTDAVFGRLENENGSTGFHPITGKSRLSNMARAEALLLLPVGVTQVSNGQSVNVQLLV